MNKSNIEKGRPCKGFLKCWDRVFIAIVVVAIYFIAHWLVRLYLGIENLANHKLLLSTTMIGLYVLFFTVFFSIRKIINRFLSK